MSQGMKRILSSVSVGLLLLTSVATQPRTVRGSGSISDLALQYVSDAAAKNLSVFFAYEDADSGFNHGFLSGWFGSPGKIHLNAACVYDASSATQCATNTTVLDQTHGTVLQIAFDALGPTEFSGINLEEPENNGISPRGVGYDLRGATKVCFDALSTSPNFRVQFAVAQQRTLFYTLPTTWTHLCVDFASIGLSQSALTDVHYLFTIVTNGSNAPSGGSLLLDNIQFEPVPTSQSQTFSWPVSNTTFGTVPVSAPRLGRVAIPPDQILKNLATLYEASIAVRALLARGNAQDLVNAKFISDSTLYMLSHDNQGDPLPSTIDGSHGLHNATMSGDAYLKNSQIGGGAAGQVRLAGFSLSSEICGPSHYCLVLDGSTGGNTAFAVIALLDAYRQFNDPRYLDGARQIGSWIYSRMRDTSGTGYGGYFLGYPDSGVIPKTIIPTKSVENNADIFSAFTLLSQAAGISFFESIEWKRRAKIAGDFVIAMFNPAGMFYGGTVPVGSPAIPGIVPNGAVKGNDVINTYPYMDAQTFTVLALAGSSQYRNAIDWRRPVQGMIDHFAQTVTAAGASFSGFDLVENPVAGPNGVAWEFTGQAVVAMRFVDALYDESRFEALAASYENEIAHAQQAAPFGGGLGVVAATMQDGNLLPPYEQCLSTPWQCIAERDGVAATVWATFADLNVNPLGKLKPEDR